MSRKGRDFVGEVPKRTVEPLTNDKAACVMDLLQQKNRRGTTCVVTQADFANKVGRFFGQRDSYLTAELLAFKVSISLKGHDSYGNDQGQWRENPHDDLVLAVALAVWYGEHMPRLLALR